ncbi:MAG: hypothetical protein HZA93_21200 [Verrucomicrobia bacterium]|nr:hypothetical protein [Verrucomicrobiota bacterium]
MLARYLIVDWPQFFAAIFLLLTPGSLFYRSKKIRYREISREWDDHLVRVLAHGLHAIDLVRAALGTWLLLEALPVERDAHGLAKYTPLFVQGLVQILAVWLQTVTCPEPEHANAPFAFVIGLLLAGSSPAIAAFACALALPLTMGARTPGAFFPLLGLTHLVAGYFFKEEGGLLGLGFGAIAAMVPFVWALLFRRELVIAYRAGRLSEDQPLDPLR